MSNRGEAVQPPDHEADRKRAETALESSERHLRTALDTMLEGVAIQTAIRDGQGRIVDFTIDYANSAIGMISGTAGSLQAGRTLLELFPAHRTNGLFDAYVGVVETGVPFERMPSGTSTLMQTADRSTRCSTCVPQGSAMATSSRCATSPSARRRSGR